MCSSTERNEDSSFSLSSVCLFQCDSSTETQQTVTSMCQTVSNTNSVAFTLGMHDISVTISVSADKCPFFSVIGIGLIRKTGRYL